MTESEKFILKMAESLKKKLPKNMKLLIEDDRPGMLEVSVVGATTASDWPKATIKLYEGEREIRCSSYIWPGSRLPEIVKEELNIAVKRKFSSAGIEIPYSELYKTNTSKIIEDLYGALCFYIEKIKKCKSIELEQKLREKIKESLEI